MKNLAITLVLALIIPAATFTSFYESAFSQTESLTAADLLEAEKQAMFLAGYAYLCYSLAKDFESDQELTATCDLFADGASSYALVSDTNSTDFHLESVKALNRGLIEHSINGSLPTMIINWDTPAGSEIADVVSKAALKAIATPSRAPRPTATSTPRPAATPKAQVETRDSTAKNELPKRDVFPNGALSDEDVEYMKVNAPDELVLPAISLHPSLATTRDEWKTAYLGENENGSYYTYKGKAIWVQYVDDRATYASIELEQILGKFILRDTKAIVKESLTPLDSRLIRSYTNDTFDYVEVYHSEMLANVLQLPSEWEFLWSEQPEGTFTVKYTSYDFGLTYSHISLSLGNNP